MARGTVAFFNDSGGYGFIETDAADDDVFFHMADIEGPDLEEGQEVEFEIEEAEEGPRATNVERLDS
ncbi:MAG: cold-shock protein [Halobacteriaceae archaeon]